MTNSKEIRPQVYENFVMPDFSGIDRLSKMLVEIQGSQLQHLAQTIIESQTRIFANATFISNIDEFAKTVQKALIPTRALMDSLTSSTSSLNIAIASFQNIGNNLSLTLKAINEIVDISTNTVKTTPEIESIKEGTSCLVSMSAEVEEKRSVSGIVYKNSTEVKIVAEISDIKEGQKEILAKLASLEAKDTKCSIPAKLVNIGFVNNNHSLLDINGTIVKFRGGIASVVLYVIFGRKNFSRTRTYEVEDFCNKYDETLDWFSMSKNERKAFQDKVYQSIRNINNRFMEATNLGEKLIISSCRNSYILNPKLFK